MTKPLSEPIALTPVENALLALAKRVAEDSPDRSRKVGAVLVAPDGSILSAACNTLPDGVPHDDAYLQRPAKYNWTEHAERNAIFAAAKAGGVGTQGCSMVLPWFPCMQCARAICQAGITRVVAQYPDVTDPLWGAEFIDALKLFELKGVQFDHYVDDAPMAQSRAEGDPLVSAPVDLDRPQVSSLIQAWNDEVERVARQRRALRPS